MSMNYKIYNMIIIKLWILFNLIYLMPWPGPQKTPVMLMNLEPELIAMQSSSYSYTIVKIKIKQI